MVKKIKVLMIAPTPFFADRGCHVRIVEEIKFLQLKGHQVILLTYPIGKDVEGLDIRRVPGAPWYRKLSAGPSLHKFYLDPFLVIKGLWLALREKPDIIHVHLHEGIAIGLVISLLTGRKMVADLQGSLVEELIDHDTFIKGGLTYKLLKFIERKLSKSAGHIIVSSKNTMKTLRKFYSLENGKISWVGDGVDLNDFYPQEPSPDLREKWSIRENNRVVVFLGLLTMYQGVDLLLEAFTRIIKSVPDAHLIVMGYPNVEYYRELADSLMLKDHVTFTGRVPYELAREYISLGELAVAPKMSLTEANGKLYNYMACELPVVTFDTPVNREILGDKGVYARYGDRESFADMIIDLLRDPDRGKALGRDLRAIVEVSFSWKKSVDRIIECYNHLIAGEGVSES